MKDSREYKRNINGKDRIWGGVFILLIGVAALVKSFVVDLDWLFSWQMLLIAIGCFLGLRSNFRGGAWLVLILIGSYFLVENYFVMDHSLRKMFWPLALIVLGAYLIFRPGKGNFFYAGKIPKQAPPAPDQSTTDFTDTVKTDTAFTNNDEATTIAGEEILDVAAVFGSVKKNIYSKNFRGGEIVCVFGGAEINLTQASFQQPQIVIESVQIFGGAKLILPADWVIHNEAVAIFGGIEDKRPQPVALPVPAKVLVLKGFVMFGGIEIKSY